ncbi:hypothetical protein [Vibrio sp. VB16]|uniref:hypothetical protein n=1 Tax=Vibrio sp. VB16 TaxID=2785746 RepID=UPI00189D8528|nr:hypothetical protein [Vibrio sp. VB16]UGA57274.1 hypothetical protein IUZ65_017390 [Vibrio sp. VB16]
MKLLIHRISAIIATLCVVTFFTSTIIVELFGSLESVAQVKSFIVSPGLFILIPAIALTGATGFLISKGRKGRLIESKKKRMPFIAMNGLLILLPSAIMLNQWAMEGSFDTAFYIVQALELIAGFINASLMILNIRDGRKFTHKR